MIAAFKLDSQSQGPEMLKEGGSAEGLCWSAGPQGTVSRPGGVREAYSQQKGCGIPEGRLGWLSWQRD